MLANHGCCPVLFCLPHFFFGALRPLGGRGLPRVCFKVRVLVLVRNLEKWTWKYESTKECNGMWKILNVIIQLYTVYLVSISISFIPLKLLESQSPIPGPEGIHQKKSFIARDDVLPRRNQPLMGEKTCRINRTCEKQSPIHKRRSPAWVKRRESKKRIASLARRSIKNDP